tara:strand:- start:595 stop:1041 length:447 start_codon:yes stop_codon:yes gene_type:complete
MDIFIKLPSDIRNGLFRYFAHPVAEKIAFHNSSHGRLMEDIRDYSRSLKQLYKLPFAKNHDGKWGRASLLNYLWLDAHIHCGNYYKIWERMFRIHCPETAKRWISTRYSIQCHVFQINALWALFTPRERAAFLKRGKEGVYCGTTFAV